MSSEKVCFETIDFSSLFFMSNFGQSKISRSHFFLLSTLNHIQCSGIIPTRPVAPNTRRQWKDLAQIFVRLLGGNASCQQAANYLNALADDTLPAEEVIPLTWHEEASVIEVLPIAREEPHPVVLATLSPSVPLRAVWRRRR